MSLGGDPSERDNSIPYQKQVMDLEYDAIMRIAASNLLLGNNVVLDAPFGRYLPDDEYIVHSSEKYGWPDDAHAVIIHVRVESNVVKARVASRGLARDAWKLAHWDEFWETAGIDPCHWRGAVHMEFDNNSPDADFAELVGKIPL